MSPKELALLEWHGGTKKPGEAVAFVAGWDAAVEALTARNGLTPRQASVLRAVVELRDEAGCAPTLGEISAKLGVSKVTVHEGLRALRDKGRVEWEPHKARSIRLIGGAT